MLRLEHPRGDDANPARFLYDEEPPRAISRMRGEGRPAETVYDLAKG
jgi:hypothetical protein